MMQSFAASVKKQRRPARRPQGSNRLGGARTVARGRGRVSLGTVRGIRARDSSPVRQLLKVSPMNARFWGALSLALLAALTLFGVDAQVVAPKFRGSSLTAPPHDWPTNGGDWYNRRYSPLSEISRST